MLKQKYRQHDRVLLCDDSNKGNSGYPKPKMLESDGYHLSFDEVVVLAANIKHSIDNAHGAQSSGDRSEDSGSHNRGTGSIQYNREYQQRGFSRFRGYHQRYFQGGRFSGNWRGRGRRS